MGLFFGFGFLLVLLFFWGLGRRFFHHGGPFGFFGHGCGHHHPRYYGPYYDVPASRRWETRERSLPPQAKAPEVRVYPRTHPQLPQSEDAPAYPVKPSRGG